ncbi:hypothetical protein Tco_0985502 [Tanacetum coccineum]
MEASISTPGNESTEKVKKEYTKSNIENKPKSKRQKQLPRYDCKKQFNQKMVVNEEWLAGNDEYIERKVLKEMKLKRKREEKNHLVDGQEVMKQKTWPRNITAARYRKFKKK